MLIHYDPQFAIPFYSMKYKVYFVDYQCPEIQLKIRKLNSIRLILT